MSKLIRIGTRDSELALWQANAVQQQLEHFGHKTILVPVKSTGDMLLDKPIYELGIVGVFTRILDEAMLNNQIDIAALDIDPTHIAPITENAASADNTIIYGRSCLAGDIFGEYALTTATHSPLKVGDTVAFGNAAGSSGRSYMYGTNMLSYTLAQLASYKRTIADKHSIQSKKPLLILDLSIPRNVNQNVKELSNVSLIHLDDLSKMTDDTLERRKEFIPLAEQILEEVKLDFNSWLNTRKFAPTINALKHKLLDFKNAELETQRKKFTDFNEAQAELISNNIIQKITNHFAYHLKTDDMSTDESIELIKRVFQLESASHV